METVVFQACQQIDDGVISASICMKENKKGGVSSLQMLQGGNVLFIGKALFVQNIFREHWSENTRKHIHSSAAKEGDEAACNFETIKLFFWVLFNKEHKYKDITVCLAIELFTKWKH